MAKTKRTYKKWNAKQKGKFLKTLTETCNVSAACRMIKVSRSQAYTLRDNEEKFKNAWDDAIEEATDYLEAEARRRAMEGDMVPLIHQGKQVTDKEDEPMFMRKYSNSLMTLLLKGRRPDVFKDRLEAKHSVSIEDELDKL